jgi:hypothetical protein
MAGLVDALFARSGISLGVRPPKLSTKKYRQKIQRMSTFKKKYASTKKKKMSIPFDLAKFLQLTFIISILSKFRMETFQLFRHF